MSHSLFGLILGLLHLEDARVSPVRNLGQYQQVVAPEALRRLPLPLRIAVDPGEGDAVARLSCNVVLPNCCLDSTDPNFFVGFLVKPFLVSS